ncbi:hypothetical protein H4217_002415 [Coemansia sp. RSA 1939]|nr:hypothetical protein H4217_002415 [Coemansia sp. RSA 1939]KAJ2612460.1 hypothetical protein EV177_002989 [Coemansia sp. RSA 1804]
MLDSTTLLSRKQTHGALHNIASSAWRLARSVANNHGASSSATADLSALSEAKTGQTEGSLPMAQTLFAESSYYREHSTTDPVPLAESSGPAAAFRLAARSKTSNPLERTNNRDIHLQQTENTLSDTHFSGKKTQSHQVKLAEDLDGHGVVEFLSQNMPTSMSTGGISALTTRDSGGIAHGYGTQQSGWPNLVDPVAYLQETTYAADMEAFDHQVPRAGKGEEASRTNVLSASPSGLAKAWDEHSASILEEWELNEAWDRAWMDTTWSSAQGKEKPNSKSEPASNPTLPSNRNLGYLLKPRI